MGGFMPHSLPAHILLHKIYRENALVLGAATRRDGGGIAQDLQRLFVTFPILHERRSQKAGALSGGQQQMLAIGRALMARPRLLLIDEPSAGLAPVVVQDIMQVIRDLHAAG
jgi:branched-chain amino acid transport system ATP-binding protein